MRLERVVHTIEINHRANKPIYPITFETDNDNNTIIPSIVSTKVAEKPAILPIFKTIENRRSIFFSLSSPDFCTCRDTSPRQLISFLIKDQIHVKFRRNKKV